jgi:hypothetical protein
VGRTRERLDGVPDTLAVSAQRIVVRTIVAKKPFSCAPAVFWDEATFFARMAKNSESPVLVAVRQI